MKHEKQYAERENEVRVNSSGIWVRINRTSRVASQGHNGPSCAGCSQSEIPARWAGSSFAEHGAWQGYTADPQHHFESPWRLAELINICVTRRPTIRLTEPMERKKPNVAALLSMYWERETRGPRGPAPCLLTDREGK